MDKGGGGLLETLAPILGIGAALAAPELLPALGIGEAAGGGAAAATLADTAGGIAPEALLAAPEAGLAGEAVGTAAPLGAEALSGIGDVTGLLGAAGPAIGQAAGLGAAAPGSLLGADQAATTAAPALANTAAPAAAPNAIGTLAATPSAPGISGTPLPGINPVGDLTQAGGLPGPPAGATVNMFATDAADPGGAAPVAGVDYPAPDLLNPGQPGSIGGSAIGPAIGGGGSADFSGAQGGIEGFASSVGDWAAGHPGALLTAGLAGTQLLQGQPSYPAASTIAGIASPTAATGAGLTAAGGAGLQGQAATTAGETAALTAPLTTGILPPGLQQTVDQATQSQKAQVRSTYAAQGLTGSTMEADKLAQVDANAASQKAGIAEGLLPAAEAFSGQTNQAYSQLSQTGAALSGLSLSAYNDLLRTQMQSDENYQAALYKFAAALAGGGYQPPAANA
jgi:hypothetical protein